MIKRKTRKLSVKTEGNFKNDKIVFCFLVYSTSKFVEFLLVKLNSFFIKYEYKKKNKSNINKRFIELSVSLDNYISLKKELIFELDKEQLKFKFLYILLKKKKLSVSFFEKNYFNDRIKEDALKDLNKFILFNLLIKNVFFFKFFIIFYYIFIETINNLNYYILKKL